MSSGYRENDRRTVSLRHEQGGLRQTFTVTGTHFVLEWESSDGKGRNEVPLRELSSEVTYLEGRAAGDPVSLERALLAGGLAAVAWFSALQEHAPLLAPFLILVAALYGYRAYRASGHSRWSVVSHKDGRQVATIDHVGCDAAALEELLRVLRERVGAERRAVAIDARTE